MKISKSFVPHIPTADIRAFSANFTTRMCFMASTIDRKTCASPPLGHTRVNLPSQASNWTRNSSRASCSNAASKG